MKTIGIIEGMTWLSSIDYYRMLNEMIVERTDGRDAGKIILYSLNFGEIKALTEADDWNELANITCEAARRLEQGGADCILIGANTMHKIADTIQASVKIPIIHIAEVTADAAAKQALKKIALLGTKYTMQLDFYKEKFAKQNIATIIPDDKNVEYLNYTIYNVMGKGIFTEEIKQRLLQMIDELIAKGAEGIVLGCTEIPILIKQKDCKVPVFDTTALHAKAAVDFALQ